MENTDNNQNVQLLKKSLSTIKKLRQKFNSDPIAIIGMACRFPGGVNSPKEFWKFLQEGVSGNIDIPKDRWDIDEYYDATESTFGKMYVRKSNFLKNKVDEFDARFFNISPAEANSMDPQHRHLLEISWEALENAGENPHELKGSKTGVFIGISSSSEYNMLPRDESKINQYIATGSSASIASGRISFFYGLNGPSLSIDTACSSSLVACNLAVSSLRLNECNMAIVGGTNLILSPLGMSTLCMIRAISKDGNSKPFDANADGYGRGEGIGIIILKRLSDAEKNNDTILAIIRGGAVNNDGESAGLTVPNGKAQRNVISQALENASIKPHEVSFIESHGTGTPLGDPIEMSAILETVGKDRTADNPLYIGAVKGNIGHLENGAGIASLIKVILSLYHRKIPQNINFKELNPRINLQNTNVIIPVTNQEWLTNPNYPKRIAGISSFGFSGTNSHIILEEASLLKSKITDVDPPFFTLSLSAKDEEDLVNLIIKYQDYIKTNTEISLKDICYTVNMSRPVFTHRAYFIFKNLEDLQKGFLQIISKYEKYKTLYLTEKSFIGNSDAQLIRTSDSRKIFEEELDGTLYLGKADGSIKPKITFIFNGNMDDVLINITNLYGEFPIFQEAFNNCFNLFQSYSDMSAEKLMNTNFQQLDNDLKEYTIFAYYYAIVKLFEMLGIFPQIVFGERIGNFIAAVSAEIISLETAVKYLREFQNITKNNPNLKTLRIYVSEEKINEYLNSQDMQISIAAVYAKKDLVLIGQAADINNLINYLKTNSIEYFEESERNWPCSQYITNFNKIAAHLSDETCIKVKYRFISNTSAETTSTANVKSLSFIKDHVIETINYEKSLTHLYNQGYRIFIEFGSSPINNKDSNFINSFDNLVNIKINDQTDIFLGIYQCIAKLFCLGANINWFCFYQNKKYNKEILPNYPFKKEHYWFVKPGVHSQSADNSFIYYENLDTIPDVLSGRRLLIPGNLKYFEFNLSYKNFSEIKDNSGVLHIGYYLEILARIIKNYFSNQEYLLNDMEFISPFFLFENETKTIILSIDNLDHNNDLIFKFFSKREDQANWSLHAQGKIKFGKIDINVDLESNFIQDLKKELIQTYNRADFYKLLENRGFDIGESVKWVDQMWSKEREALIKFMENNTGDTLNYVNIIHPGVLDSCAQTFNTVLPENIAENKRYMMTNLHNTKLQFKENINSLYAYIKINACQDAELKGQFKIFNSDGEVYAYSESIQMKEFDEEKMISLKIAMDDYISNADLTQKFKKEYNATSSDKRLLLISEYLRDIFINIIEISPDKFDINSKITDFGMDSIIGVLFHKRIEDVFSITLAITDIAGELTMRDIAMRLIKYFPEGDISLTDAQKEELREKDIDNRSEEELWIYNKKNNPGAKYRLFCFPYGFQSADYFKSWQEKLYPDIDVCAVQVPGMDSSRIKEKPPKNIDEIITVFVNFISKKLIDLPLGVFGHSWGALFAYRLGYLLSQNEKARLTHLFVSGYTSPSVDNALISILQREIKKIGYTSIPDFEQIKRDNAIDTITNMIINARNRDMSEELYEREFSGIKITLEGQLTALQIVENYQFNGKDILRAPIFGFHGIDDTVVSIDNMNAWEDLTTSSFKLYTLPGDHGFIDVTQSGQKILNEVKSIISNDIKSEKSVS